jgi:hypothetical protein
LRRRPRELIHPTGGKSIPSLGKAAVLRLHWFRPRRRSCLRLMLIPGAVVVPMVLGGVAAGLWKLRAPQSETAHRLPLSSGLIAGEAMVAIVIPVLVWLGWMKG